MQQQVQEGITPYGYTFNGAYSFGESKRTDWVTNKDSMGTQCGRNHFEQRQSTAKTLIKQDTTLPKDEKLKVRVQEGAAVGQYDIATDLGKLDPKGQLDKTKNWPKAEPIKEKENPIGPCTYQPKILGRTYPQFSFGYKEEANWGKDGPAPNVYQNMENTSSFGTTVSWKSKKKNGFGGAKRGLLPKSIDVGPGQYQTVREEGQKTMFPKGQRDFFKPSKVPGPGTYPVKGTLSQTAFSIGGKYVPFKTSDYHVPGPGAYQAQLPSTVKNIKMPKDTRKDLISAEQKPGPGAYEHEIPKVQHLEKDTCFDQSERPDPNSEEKLKKFRVPSPGRYEIQSSLSGPKFSIRMKNERLNLNNNPGPGHYEPEDDQDPVYHYTVPQTATPSMGRANRSDPILSKFKIGPGSYQLSTASSGTRPSIPKASRFPVRDSENVGPGQYNIPSSIGIIPRYFFEKFKEQINPQLSKF